MEYKLSPRDFLSNSDIEKFIENKELEHFFDNAMKSVDEVEHFSELIKKLYAKELFESIINLNPKCLGNHYVFGMLVLFGFNGDLKNYEVKKLIQSIWN